jgi:hypothetical protein
MSAGRLSERKRAAPPHETVQETALAIGPTSSERTVVLARRDPLGEALVAALFRVGHAHDRCLRGERETT